MEEVTSSEQQRTIYIFELILLSIVSISTVSIILLVLNIFNSLYSVIIGIILLLALLKYFKLEVKLHDSRFDKVILIILLFSLLLRVGPYLFLTGGADHGVYVNMSSTYERTGSTFIHDDVREKLTTDLKKYYDENSNKNGAHFPGVYIYDIEKSKYVFQFYPLHPIWMAIAAKLLGGSNRVYSLVLLSIISIIAFFLIALEFSSGRKFPAYLVAFLLAINPLHTYFSKLPVSEIAFLAFTSTCFYCLIKYYKFSLKRKIEPFYLFLSAGLMLCAFFTRISGFMYVPFFYLLLIVTSLFKTEGESKKQLIIYYFSILFLYFLSVLYGLNYSWPYSHDVYQISFSKVLGSKWRIILPIILSFMTVIPFILYLIKSENINSILKKTILFLKESLPYILFIVILLGFYRAYQIGFTSELLHGQRFENLTNNGLESLWYSSIVVSVLYLSPIGFILFIFAINYCRNKKDVLLSWLLLFIIFFWFYCTVIRVVLPSHYYFSRYIISETIPYTTLLFSLYIGYLYSKNNFSKVLSFLFIGLITINLLFFTLFQFKVRTAEGANETLNKISMQIDEDDLLLFNLCNFEKAYMISTPLNYYYNKKTFYIDNPSDIRLLGELLYDYDDIFMLSKIGIENTSIELIDSIRFKHYNYPKTNTFSLKVIKENTSYDINMFLYKIDKRGLGILYPKNIQNEGFYYNSCWTNGDGKLLNLKYRISEKDKYLILASKGWHPEGHDQNLKVYVNGIELQYDHLENWYYYFLLNESIDEINEIRIVSSTFVPKDEGMNEDKRILGIYIDHIKVE